MRSINYFLGLIFLIVLLGACHNDNKKVERKKTVVIKGFFTFGPEAALFMECKTGREYWTADSSKKLELQYSQMNADRPYASAFVEVEGYFGPSVKEGPATAFDSTLTVTRLISIKKDMPKNACK